MSLRTIQIGKLKERNVVFWISLFLVLLAWFVVGEYALVDPIFLPSLPHFWERTIYLFGEGAFLIDILYSVLRVVVAFFISVLVAVPLSALMSESRTLSNLIGPYVDFIRYLPVPALIPLTILIFGIGEESKIALLFIGTFFQLILLLIDDFKQIPSSYLDLAFSLKYSPTKRLKMKLSAVLPQLYDNCRITLGWCWTYLVIAELVASKAGIGHMIKEAQRFTNTADVFVGILTMGVIGFASDNLFKFLYPRFFKYL